MIGKTPGEFNFSGEDPGKWEKTIQQVGRTAQPVEMECEMACKQGVDAFNWRLIPETDLNGNCCSILSIARDNYSPQTC